MPSTRYQARVSDDDLNDQLEQIRQENDWKRSELVRHALRDFARDDDLSEDTAEVILAEVKEVKSMMTGHVGGSPTHRPDTDVLPIDKYSANEQEIPEGLESDDYEDVLSKEAIKALVQQDEPVINPGHVNEDVRPYGEDHVVPLILAASRWHSIRHDGWIPETVVENIAVHILGYTKQYGLKYAEKALESDEFVEKPECLTDDDQMWITTETDAVTDALRQQYAELEQMTEEFSQNPGGVYGTGITRANRLGEAVSDLVTVANSVPDDTEIKVSTSPEDLFDSAEEVAKQNLVNEEQHNGETDVQLYDLSHLNSIEAVVESD